jgi:hypothetical protein
MDVVLKIMGGSLGLLVPCLFIIVLVKGIDRAPFDAAKKASSRSWIMGLVVCWTITVWALSLAGAFSYHAGDSIPRVMIPLFVPVLAGLGALASRDFRAILDHTPLAALVGVQSFRFAGAAFFLVVYLGILPSAFATGGYGDLVTASLAVIAALLLTQGPTAIGMAAFWGFTLAGLFDLLNVAYLILRYYPIWYQDAPSSGALSDFALIMIPAVAAPLALLLHTYAIRRVVQGATHVTASVAPTSAGGARP